MSYPFSPPRAAAEAPAELVVDAIRCWHEARDRHHPVLPTLFAHLEIRQAGFLAPALNALLSMYEACIGRRFSAGELAAEQLTEDEERVLTLLSGKKPPESIMAARSSLLAPLYVAARSTRIVIERLF